MLFFSRGSYEARPAATVPVGAAVGAAATVPVGAAASEASTYSPGPLLKVLPVG